MTTKRSFLRIALVFMVAITLNAQAAPSSHEKAQSRDAAKIKFRLDDIRPDGLRGPPDGSGSVAYEFCVPADEKVYKEVRKIDPSVAITHGSHGRVGCTESQSLCIGRTNQPHWREVLKALAALKYVTEIRECFFE